MIHTQKDTIAGFHRSFSHTKESYRKTLIALQSCRDIVRTNSRIHQRLDITSLEQVLQYAKKCAEWADEAEHLPLYADSVLLEAQCLKLLGQRVEALSILQKLEARIDIRAERSKAASYFLLLGQLLQYTGSVSTATEPLLEALQHAEALKQPHLILECVFSLAKVSRELGDYARAFQYCSRALNLALELESLDIGSIYLELGVVLILLDDRDQGWEFLNKSEECFRAIDNLHGLVFVYQARGVLLCNTYKYNQALAAHNESLRLAEICGNATSRMFISLGDLHCQLENYPEAIRCFARAATMASNAGDRAVYAYAERYAARTLIAMGDVDQAEAALQRCLLYLHEHFESAPEYSAIYPMLSEIAEKRQDFPAALEYHKLYHQWREKVRNEQLQQSLQQEKHKLGVERAAREREELRVKSMTLEHELKEKRAELAATIMALSQKNEVIEKLYQQIKTLSASHDTDRKQSCERMIHEIESLKHSGKQQWEALQQQLQSVDPEFQATLARHHSSLTQVEMKVCLLMRLNLKSKDIANIMWCSARTVETHRYAIRKKLKLEKDDNLYSYLSRL